MEKLSITKKLTQRKTSRVLKTDVFQIRDDKKIGRLFSKYEVLFLDKVNYSSDTSQRMIP